MALKIKKTREIKSYIPTASMADITFMLIIFFVLTTTFTVDKTTVELPDALSRKEAAQESALVLVHVEYDRSTGRPLKMIYRYSEGMLSAWTVGDPIDLAGDPNFDAAFGRVQAEVLPILARDVRCTLNPSEDSGDGTQCYQYMRARNPKYPEYGTKQWADLERSIRQKRFIIKADRKVPYRFIDPVIQTLRDNNAFEVFLLTEEKAAS